VDRAGLRRKLLKAQAEAGDIVLLFGDETIRNFVFGRA
jgi:hypothetical protein